MTLLIATLATLISAAIGYVPYKLFNVKNPRKIIDYGKRWMSLAFLCATIVSLTPFFSSLLIHGMPDVNRLIILPILLFSFGAISFLLGNLFGYIKLRNGKVSANTSIPSLRNDENQKVNSKSQIHEPDEKWFLAATLEIDEERHNLELWSKVITQCRGDQNEARFIYIEKRAFEMQLENSEYSKQKLTELNINVENRMVFCTDCHNNFQLSPFQMKNIVLLRKEKCPKCGASSERFSSDPEEILVLIEKFENE